MGRKFISLFITLFLIFGGCYFPNKKTELVSIDTVEKDKEITTPSKVYLNDGTIVLFQKGFRVENDQITGMGRGYYLNDPFDQEMKTFSIPLNNIAALTYHKVKTEGGSGLGSFVLGITALPLTVTALYCLVNPKACFGSCPTVYVKENGQYRFCSELFSYSISPYMEADDLDLLIGNLDPTPEFLDVRITNEALETHFINEMELIRVTHPKNTAVFPTPDNQLLLFSEFNPPEEAKNSKDADVRSQIAKNDQVGYRSPEDLVLELKNGAYFDFLDLKMKVPPSISQAKLLLKIRNTLLSTVLFYEVVLASQGIDALSWTERMNTDPGYANLFQSVYHTFSGITIKIKKGDEWVAVEKINDVGPIAYKYIAVILPTYNQEELRVRLEFIPDNFIFDGIFFDYNNEEDEKSQYVEVLECESIWDSEGQERKDLMKSLSEKDDLYMVTEPSDVYHFFYPLKKDVEGHTSSLFVRARGYYTEWLRGKWLTEKSTPNYRFDLSDFTGTFNQLVDSWLSNKTMMEDAFHKTRIPIRKEKCLEYRKH